MLTSYADWINVNIPFNESSASVILCEAKRLVLPVVLEQGRLIQMWGSFDSGFEARLAIIMGPCPVHGSSRGADAGVCRQKYNRVFPDSRHGHPSWIAFDSSWTYKPII